MNTLARAAAYTSTETVAYFDSIVSLRLAQYTDLKWWISDPKDDMLALRAAGFICREALGPDVSLEPLGVVAIKIDAMVPGAAEAYSRYLSHWDY